MVLDDAEARGAGRRRPARAPLQRQGLRRSDRAASSAPRGRTSPSAASSSSIRFRCATCARCSTRYPNAEEIVWVQEEPENMGAWDFIRPHLLEVAGRTAACAASPGRAARVRRKARRRATRSISRRSSSRPWATPLLPSRQRPSATPKRHSSRVRVPVARRWRRRRGASARSDKDTPTHGFEHRRARGRRIDRRRARREVAAKEGDAVAAGDPLVELETDKIDLEVARRRPAC